MMKKNDNVSNRILFLEKIADLSTALGAAFIGKSISSKSNFDKDLLDAAYNVSVSGENIDSNIASAVNKERVGETIAAAAALLAYKNKMPLKVAMPIALAALGFSSGWSKDATNLKRLKGKKIMANNMKDI